MFIAVFVTFAVYVVLWFSGEYFRQKAVVMVASFQRLKRGGSASSQAMIPCLPRRGILGDGFCSFRDGVLGELTRQQKPDCSLDLSQIRGGKIEIPTLINYNLVTVQERNPTLFGVISRIT